MISLLFPLHLATGNRSANWGTWTLIEFKMMVAAMIDVLIRDALDRGAPTDAVFRTVSAESLELAARIHLQQGGSDSNFLGMAKDLLDHVRTGARDQ